MSFADEIENSSQVHTFVVLEPGLLADNWTLDASLGSGTNVYYHALHAGSVTSFVVNNATTFTAATTLVGFGTSTNDKYFHDLDNNLIYADFTTVLPADFTTEDYVHIKYKFHACSKEVIHFSDPLNDASTQVYWYPVLAPGFSIKRSLDQNLRGFVPSFSSNIELINVGAEVYQLLGKSTLSNSDIVQYAVSGDPMEVDNTVKLFTGICTSSNATDSGVSIGFTDLIERFAETVPYSGGVERFLRSTYPNLDSRIEGQPVKEVWGCVDGVAGTNIDFLKTGTGNLEWVLCKHYDTDQTGDYLDLTVVSNAGNSATRTYFASVAGVQASDCLLNATSPSGKCMMLVLSVDFNNNSIDHINITGATFSAPLPTVGHVYRRDRVGLIQATNNARNGFIILDRGAEQLFPSLDMAGSVTVDTTNKVLKVTWTGGFATSFLNNADYEYYLWGRVFGERVSSTIGGSAPNKQSSLTGTSSAWYQVLYEFLRKKLALTEAEIDSTVFSALEASATKEADVGFLIPQNQGEEMPPIRDVVGKILSCKPATISSSTSGVFKLKSTGPFGSIVRTFTKDDIFAGSLNYEENYSEANKRIYLKYAPKDISSPTDQENVGFNPIEETVEKTDSLVASIYPTIKSETIHAPIYTQSEAYPLLDKFGHIYFWPKNILTFDVSLANIDLDIGDVIEISREVMPGYYGTGSLKTAKYIIISLELTDSRIKIKCWDQKGIQRNQGDF